MLSAPGIYNNNIPTAEGQTFHGDHLYAFYQIPQNAKALPIVMLHGAYQSARSWETTPDGREGFQTIFLRRGFPVYLVDQPRRGRAGNSTVAATIEPTPFDQLFFDQFRIGKWPTCFDNVQFKNPNVRVVERGRGARLLDEAAPARLVRGWSPEWQEGAHTRREQSGATLGGTLDQGASMRLLGGFWGFGAPLFEQQA